MTRFLRLAVTGLVVATAAQALADPMLGIGGGRRRGPLFLRQLFLPTLVMQHQSEIDLTDAQRDAITKEMAATQRQALDLRWQLEAKGSALDKLLAAEHVDEAAAMQQLGELMDLENQMKRAHLGLLIRVKNLLTPAQQAKLQKLRPARMRPGPPPGPDDAGPGDDDVP